MFVDPYLATVTVFAGNFAPRAWAFCDGSLQSIAENTALFSLLGTTYGGDGVTTFALPDLRGRYAIHPGRGPGLPNYVLGEMSGSESTTLLSTNLPAHNHIVTPAPTFNIASSGEDGNQSSPAGNIPAGTANRYSTGTADAAMASTTITTQTSVAGGSQPVSNITPFLAMNYIIAVEGIYPSRN